MCVGRSRVTRKCTKGDLLTFSFSRTSWMATETAATFKFICAAFKINLVFCVIRLTFFSEKNCIEVYLINLHSNQNVSTNWKLESTGLKIFSLFYCIQSWNQFAFFIFNCFFKMHENLLLKEPWNGHKKTFYEQSSLVILFIRLSFGRATCKTSKYR